MGIDISLTTIMFDDKIKYEKPKWALRPSLGLTLGLMDIPKGWPVSFDVYTTWSYLWPIEFYEGNKFSTIRENGIVVNIKLPITVPISSDQIK